MPRRSQQMQKADDVFHLHEANAIWREVLHLGSFVPISKGYRWQDAHTEQRTFSFLHKGTIRIFCSTYSGRERNFLELSSGCIFRETSIFYSGQRFTVHQEAVENCEVYNFPAELLYKAEFIQKYPLVIANIIRTLGVKLGAITGIIADSIKPKPEVVVGNFFLDVAKRNAKNIPSAGVSQGELAIALGLHRSTVCRVIHDMRKRGIVGKVSRKNIEIFDEKALRKFCEDDE